MPAKSVANGSIFPPIQLCWFPYTASFKFAATWYGNPISGPSSPLANAVAPLSPLARLKGTQPGATEGAGGPSSTRRSGLYRVPNKLREGVQKEGRWSFSLFIGPFGYQHTSPLG